MKTLAFDIESADADQLHSYGPGFVRLCGMQWLDENAEPIGSVAIDTDAGVLVTAIEQADAITAHNGLNFDLLALAKYHGLGYEKAALKCFDTLTVEKHLDPVAARGAQPNGYYTLDAVADRYGVGGKAHVDFAGKVEIARRINGDKSAERMLKTREAAVAKAVRTGTAYNPGDTFGVLKVLADLYGGFDKIPVDDPDYVRYLRFDVEAQSGVFRAQLAATRLEDVDSQRYVRREHYVAASMGRVTLEGFRTDVDLTMRRWSEGQARLEAAKQGLHEKHGMPLEGKKPHTTNPGKAAFRAAILATGISETALDANWPLNSDGSLSTGKDVLAGMIEIFDRSKPEAAELCRTIMAMNGERTVYGTVLSHLVGDRVHPYIGADQSSGRWSMKDPGLTVLGKRGGKARERAMMIADEGDVLVAIDADQIDARMIAALSQDPEYMKLFEPGVDLHSEVALRVFNRPECREEMARNNGRCDCEYRDKAKVFGHGWNYGMGPNSMARNHGVDVEVARRFDQGMQEAFPVLCRWKDDVRQQAGAVGFDEAVPANDSYRILHTIFGRPVRVERTRAYTQGCAQLGQGSTRDGMAEAILKLPPYYRRRIRAVIHDEIVVSIPAGPDAQDRAQALADSMAYDIRGIRISFGCSRVSRTWAGCYGEQYEEAA